MREIIANYITSKLKENIPYIKIDNGYLMQLESGKLVKSDCSDKDVKEYGINDNNSATVYIREQNEGVVEYFRTTSCNNEQVFNLSFKVVYYDFSNTKTKEKVCLDILKVLSIIKFKEIKNIHSANIIVSRFVTDFENVYRVESLKKYSGSVIPVIIGVNINVKYSLTNKCIVC